MPLTFDPASCMVLNWDEYEFRLLPADLQKRDATPSLHNIRKEILIVGSITKHVMIELRVIEYKKYAYLNEKVDVDRTVLRSYDVGFGLGMDGNELAPETMLLFKLLVSA